MTHHRWAEIAVEKQSPFRPHWGLAAPDLFLDSMLNRRAWEAYLIDCTEALGNIYRNGSQTCHPKGTTYRDAQLGEFIHSIMVGHELEREVACGRKPAGEKRGESEIAAEWKPPRASGYEIVMSSWGWWLGVAETPLQEKHKAPFLARQISEWFYDTSTGIALEQPTVVLSWRGLGLSDSS
jgi:hypothetical protein